MIVTWNEVGHYFQNTDAPSTFQFEIAADAGGDVVVEFRYGDIQPEDLELWWWRDLGVTGRGGRQLLDDPPPASQAFDLDAIEGNAGPGRWRWTLSEITAPGLGLPQVSGGDIGETLTGGAEGEWLNALGGDDAVTGGGGDDILSLGAGDDRGAGEDGDDQLYGGDGADTLEGGTGNDTLRGGAGFDRLEGGAGDDHLFVDDGQDTVFGGAGNDVLESEASWGQLDGGPGADRFVGGSSVYASYASAEAGVQADLYNVPSWDEFVDAQTGDAAGDSFEGVYGLIGSDFADGLWGDWNDNTLIGEGGDDWLDGRGQEDSFFGGAGDDQMIGGESADYFDGGEGFDIVRYDGSPEAVQIDLGVNNATGGHAAHRFSWRSAGDFFVSVEGVSGSDHGDSLYGSEGDNGLWGWDGDDWLFGFGGNDWLVGGAGADMFTFYRGWDRDWIVDFEVGVDKIRIRRADDLQDFDDIWIGGNADGAVVNHIGDSIYLPGVARADLSESDFIFFG